MTDVDRWTRAPPAEIRMRNEGGVLRPGMYADVTFHVTRSNPPFVVPSTAVIIRSGPPRVAIVDADGTVHLQPVQLGRDFGSSASTTWSSRRRPMAFKIARACVPSRRPPNRPRREDTIARV